MLNYPIITESYPLATVIAFTEYYHPQLRWQRIDQPVDAILQFDQFEFQIRQAMAYGATQLCFTVQDEKRAHYTVHVPSKKLMGGGRIKAGR